MILVNSDERFDDFLSFLKLGHEIISSEKTISGATLLDIRLSDGGQDRAMVFGNYFDKLSGVSSNDRGPIEDAEHNSLIFGKDTTERVVGIETLNDELHIWKEIGEDTVHEILENKYWILAAKNHGGKFEELEGDLHYKYIKTYTGLREYKRALWYGKDFDIYTMYDKSESAMVFSGITLFKGMKVEEVSVLSFDIETTGLIQDKNSRVLLISNTFRRGDKVERKLFAYDDYENDTQFLEAWCSWVREVNPAIMLGHNIYSYDLPYIKHCANLVGADIRLGRDDSEIDFDQRESKFRKDGSQSYSYFKAHIYGRQIIDTMFLAMKYDIGKKYASYGLKSIIATEGLEVTDRQFYDAGTIKDNFKNHEEWKKIKVYAEHDADDALSLFDLMVAAYFYLTPSIPKTFESINNGATGSQINSFLVRAYLQDGHSVPKRSEQVDYEGSISLGNPGIYKNVFKVDVASLYPSIMRQYKVYDKNKDPRAYFHEMVEYFTIERLRNKKLSKETGDRYYKDLEQAQKIVINSAYGMLGAKGLNFNSPTNASFITQKGREILTKCIEWAVGRGYTIANGDTDSISFSSSKHLTEQNRLDILKEINSLYPEMIRWEDDGYFLAVAILKAKNYALWDGKKLKLKGSSIKDQKKEKALRSMMQEMIESILDIRPETPVGIYNKYIAQVCNITDISEWSSKKTITDKVLNPKRTNEQKVLDALNGKKVQEGDKVYVYFDVNKALKLQENFKGDHSIDHLLTRIYKTVEIFKNALNIKDFPNYALKKNKEALENLLATYKTN